MQQGIGFDAERGDSVQVVNAPFHAETPAPTVEDVPLWQQPWLLDLLRTAAAPAALALVALIALFGFVRPALKAAGAADRRRRAASSTPWSPTTRACRGLSAEPPPALQAPANNDKLDAARATGQGEPGRGGQHHARLGQRRSRLRTPQHGRQQSMDDKGLEDAAILLMSLGEEEAAEVFKHLAPEGSAAPGRDHRAHEERAARALRRRAGHASRPWPQDQNMLVADTDEYVKAVLRKALGDDKANLLIDRILQGSDVTGIESLKWMDASIGGRAAAQRTPADRRGDPRAPGVRPGGRRAQAVRPSASATRCWCAWPRWTASSRRR